MIKQKQLCHHDPDNGVYGDCFRTVIACLMDLEPRQVPLFHEHNITSNSTQVEAYRKWLSSKGLGLFEVCLSGELKNILNHINSTNPNEYYLLTGEAPGGVDHVVICRGNKIVWDTSQDNTGIVGPRINDGFYWISVLTHTLRRRAHNGATRKTN